MKKIIITLFVLLLVPLSSSLAQTSIETGSNPSLKDAFKIQQEIGERAGYNNSNLDLLDIISAVINVVLSLIGILFIILIIYSGITWMTSGGEESSVSKAKKTLKQSIIGLVIVLGAYAISYFVINLFSFLNQG